MPFLTAPRISSFDAQIILREKKNQPGIALEGFSGVGLSLVSVGVCPPLGVNRPVAAL